MDTQRLKDNFARVAMHGDEVPLFFYADLFLGHPETRGMFPLAMNVQRDRLVSALGQVVADVDNTDALVPFLRGLGRDHRKFGVIRDHYAAVGTSLINTLRYFSGPEWSAELEADWTDAYILAAQTMIEAADQDEQGNPAWWEATVVSHERRSLDTAVFRVTTSEPLTYVPGQSVSLESSMAPRHWRLYSMANAPRDDGTLDFHVHMVDGGTVSPVLTYQIRVGSRLKLGPVVGDLRLAAMSSTRDILMVAGGTGLAPLKAIVEQIAGFRNPPQVHLFFGARHADGLYDLPHLEKMAAQWPWFTVTPAVSEDPGYPGERGLISDVVTRQGSWNRHEAFICGPPAMVAASVSQLTAAGMPEDRIHTEDFGGEVA